jgi:CelD/BcsL family acetyltransferase involved in cellulose biosynthesis
MSIAPHHFKYQLSDWTLFSLPRCMQVRAYVLGATPDATLPSLQPGSDGLLLRSVPVASDPTSGLSPSLATVGRITQQGQNLLRYVVQRFPRHYINMAGKDFEAYKAKFSGKTRSTLTRRVKKFAEACGGTLRWERFTRPEELPRFWQLARDVSAKTYQERLLDAGLPDSAGYRAQALEWAAEDRLRAFLLFDGERPVSYLFCPLHDDVVEYAYLGYDPGYKHLSAGTVLQWLALESLFDEGRYRFFDFTEGESDHKRLFGTDHLQCANVALLRPTVTNRLLVHSHWRFNQGGDALGRWAERHGLKKRIRHWLRFRRRT